jgi:hypothetical protein
MSQVIIFNDDSGIPAVLMPTAEFIAAHGILEVALKDVPYNKPFKIIDTADLPTAPQEAWVVPDSALTDGVALGPERWFIKEYRAEIERVQAEQAPTPTQPMTLEEFQARGEAEELTAEEIEAMYPTYLVSVEQQNADALASWEASKVQRVEQLNAQIAAMERQIQETEA